MIYFFSYLLFLYIFVCTIIYLKGLDEWIYQKEKKKDIILQSLVSVRSGRTCLLFSVICYYEYFRTDTRRSWEEEEEVEMEEEED